MFVIFFTIFFKSTKKSCSTLEDCIMVDGFMSGVITGMIAAILHVHLDWYQELVPHKYNLISMKSKDFDKSTMSSGIFVSTYQKEGTRYYTMFMETADGIKNVMYEMDDDRVYIKESDNAFIEEYWLYHRYPAWVQKFYLVNELEIDTGGWRRPKKVVIHVPKGSIIREFSVSL